MQFYQILFEKLNMKKGTYNHFLRFIVSYDRKKEIKPKQDDSLEYKRVRNHNTNAMKRGQVLDAWSKKMLGTYGSGSVLINNE